MILIAEDDLMTRRIIGKVAIDAGHEVLYCSNGRIAWEILLDNPNIQLVITDIAMPEKDGKELIAAAHAHPELKKIPVIIISGVISLKEIDGVLALGAARFLPKPVNTVMLREYIDFYCSKEEE